MIRRLFGIAARSSLLFLMATVVLWLLSYFALAMVSFQLPARPSSSIGVSTAPHHTIAREYHVAAARGRLRIVVWSPLIRSRSPVSVRVMRLKPNDDLLPFRPWGFAASLWSDASSWFLDERGAFIYLGNSITNYDRNWLAAVPLWFVARMFAIVPSIRLIARRKLFPVNAGCCPNCGYDLRATPDRCPECRTIPAARIISPPTPHP